MDTVGAEAMPWQLGQRIPNPFPNPVFPGTTMLKDPGAKPSITAGVRWQSDSGPMARPFFENKAFCEEVNRRYPGPVKWHWGSLMQKLQPLRTYFQSQRGRACEVAVGSASISSDGASLLPNPVGIARP